MIYEDEALLVLNKPAGLTVHPNSYSPGPFLTDWLVARYPALKEVGAPGRPGIVHRLDKETSGLLVVAKTPASYQFLHAQFKARTVKKVYLLVVMGTFKAGVGSRGVISLPIGRSLKDPRLRVASHKAYGELRSAETRYEILAQHDGLSLVAAELVTGRTHQLRAHFKALQHPIICDPLYGTGGVCPAGLSRQALHAWRLKLSLPTGGSQEWEVPPPPDWQPLLALFKFQC